MYAITSGDTNFLKTHHVFDQSLVLTPKGQHWLGKARQFGHQLRCVCTGKASSPLHTRASVGGIQHPYRANGTRREHHPLCIHGESSRSTLESYGAPSGSIVANGGRIAVNFDLLMPDDEQSADGCGEWQASHSDHGAALRSLMWLLLDQSGLNYSSPERRSGDPWRALLDGASGVDVTRRGKGGLKLPRFRGHFFTQEGVRDANPQAALSGGVSSTDGRAGARRSRRHRSGPRVRL